MNKKKKQIIEAAQTLFIKKGFSATPIQDILDTANISKGTFYNYFSSKIECLMAILSFIKDEVIDDRQQLALGKSPSDRDIFVKQIAARFHIDKKHNLMALFASLGSSDTAHQELKEFLNQQYLEEVTWMAERICDVFGDKKQKYAYDNAVTCFGTIHLTSKILMDIGKTEIPIEETINFALRQIEQTNVYPPFLQEDYFLPYHQKKNVAEKDIKNSLQQTLTDLDRLIEELENNKLTYYHRFLQEQLKTDDPDLLLMESVINSYQHALQYTELEDKGKYIKMLFVQLMEEKK
ncbi:TetR/AcrR family transcriptional regulator [Oceanobacillus jeddahense]|uniref:TetR/AcrR family transcriptional regulator n=1 Tax=Oceanobacillus jeddahense TaxID=1462527 RepID=A0ABY5JTF5_9BACI|nr:TetR/AcrR family transcriptional regulator [Oceanobacillus jeddahense]UUI02351.1 TetR/AcrR family transcriptional regulator [Oceanobacillus jeddahense]